MTAEKQHARQLCSRPSSEMSAGRQPSPKVTLTVPLWPAATGFFLFLPLGAGRATANEVEAEGEADMRPPPDMCTPARCACPDIFDPVVCDGQAFASGCLARCAGAFNCSRQCACPDIF